jgi:hypothetical protein
MSAFWCWCPDRGGPEEGWAMPVSLARYAAEDFAQERFEDDAGAPFESMVVAVAPHLDGPGGQHTSYAIDRAVRFRVSVEHEPTFRAKRECPSTSPRRAVLDGEGGR